jgi:acyl dehydratase
MTSIEVDELGALRSFVGQTVAISDWLEMTQDRIDRFAELTGDRQWIHTDPERARRESPYGGTVAHGFLTMSLLSQFARRAIRIRDGYGIVVNYYGLNRVRFPGPVRAGERIRAGFGIESVDDYTGAVQVVLKVVVECEHIAKPCCVADWVIRYYPRGVEPAGRDVSA